MRKYRNTIPSKEYPGYYKNLKYGLLVSKEGKVKDLQSGEDIEYNVYPDKYSYISHLAVHRLMAETFLICPGNTEDYHVNHDDGVKTNNHLDNIEWCTRSENSIHAYETGLRPDNKPLKVKDLETGEVTHHYSLQEAARFLNVNGSVIYNYLKGSRNTPFRLKWVITNENEVFPPLTKDDVGKLPKGVGNQYIGIDIESGKGYIFFGLRSMSKYLHVAPITIQCKFLETDPVVIKGIKIMLKHEFIGDYSEFVYVGFPKTGRPVRKPVPIQVHNTKTKETVDWPSCQAFAAYLGIKKNTLQKNLLVNNGVFYNYVIRYLNRSA
jgi:hypothetical protein